MHKGFQRALFMRSDGDAYVAKGSLVYADSFSEFESALLGSIFSLAFVSKPDVQVRSVLFEEVSFL